MDNRNDTVKYRINEKWDEATIDIGVGIPWINKVNGINNKYFITYAGAKVISRSNSMLYYDFDKETIPKGLILENKKSAPQRDGNIRHMPSPVCPICDLRALIPTQKERDIFVLKSFGSVLKSLGMPQDSN